MYRHKIGALLTVFVLTAGILWSNGASDNVTAGNGSEKESNNINKPDSPMSIVGENDLYVEFRQADGKIVELPKNPQRTAVALNSLLDLWYMAGGEAVARLKGSINVPEEAAELPILGGVSTINLELILELEPDFVITSNTSYEEGLRNLCSEENIPVVSIQYRTFDDFRVIMDLFTRLTGRRDIYKEKMIPIEQGVQSIIDQVPESTAPEICILFSGTKYVKVETENTITGSICKDLGAVNIYKEQGIEGATRVDLSLEYIFERDPDIIFVTTMGNVEKCKARVKQDIESSDIWGELSAVKNGRFIYLDKSYSIYKPNRFYPEAYKIIAEFLYPGIDFVLEGQD
jgi:iron complex transport system substrate-binding protein